MSEYERLERLRIEADRWIACVVADGSTAGEASRGIRELIDRAARQPSPSARDVALTPLSPTREMIESGAQRLVRWETGDEQWPTAWSALDVMAARNDAERCWRSMSLAYAGTLGNESVAQVDGYGNGAPDAPSPAATDPAPEARELSAEAPEEVREWAAHMDLHLTEHDLRHAGLALRAAWPTVRVYLRSLQQALARAQEELASLKQSIADLSHPNMRMLIEDKKRDEAELEKVQARLDAVMLEYCPEEMSREQVDNWAKHQVAIPEVEVARKAALASAPSAKEGQTGEQSEEGK